MGKPLMTKKEATGIFKELNKKRAEWRGTKLEKGVVALWWYDFTYMLHKDGQITDKQFKSWSNKYSKGSK